MTRQYLPALHTRSATVCGATRVHVVELQQCRALHGRSRIGGCRRRRGASSTRAIGLERTPAPGGRARIVLWYPQVLDLYV